MEQNKYHASMFNVLVDEKDGLYLYNSFGGIGSIRTVEESARDKVKDILSGREIEVTEDSSSLIQRLIDDRFLVPILFIVNTKFYFFKFRGCHACNIISANYFNSDYQSCCLRYHRKQSHYSLPNVYQPHAHPKS